MPSSHSSRPIASMSRLTKTMRPQVSTWAGISPYSSLSMIPKPFRLGTWLRRPSVVHAHRWYGQRSSSSPEPEPWQMALPR